MLNLILAFYMIDPDVVPMSFREFKGKIGVSFDIIKKYKLYIFLLVLFIINAAPQLEEPVEYYLTLELDFKSFLFTLKYILLTAVTLVGVISIKNNWIVSFKKSSIFLFILTCLMSSACLLIVFNYLFTSTKLIRRIFAFLNAIFWNLGVECMVIVMLNIYITFCPKSIEATFSTFYYFIKDCGKLTSLLLQNLLVYSFDIAKTNTDFSQFIILLLANMSVYLIAFIPFSLIEMPTETSIVESDIMEISEVKEYYVSSRRILDTRALLSMRDSDGIINKR